MRRLTNQTMEQINGGGYYWQQCETEMFSVYLNTSFKCGQIYGMKYSTPFDYLYAKSVVDAAMNDHQKNCH